MSENKPKYGFTDEDLKVVSTVYDKTILKGKRVLVSGAGSGIGKAIAALFARLGADLIICGRKQEKLDSAKVLFESLGAKVLTYSVNIRDTDQVEAMMDSVWETWGGIDILVNNAGGQFPMPAIDIPVKGWNAVIDNNLNGTWFMMQNAAKRWRDHHQPGNIINIVIVIDRGAVGVAHTCAARAGIIYMSKSMAVEWAEYNIRVNCVAPGAIESNGFNHYPEEGVKTFYECNPMLDVGDANDIAQAVVYFAADSGKFVTGELINVDGGGRLWGDMWTTGTPDYFSLKD